MPSRSILDSKRKLRAEQANVGARVGSVAEAEISLVHDRTLQVNDAAAQIERVLQPQLQLADRNLAIRPIRGGIADDSAGRRGIERLEVAVGGTDQQRSSRGAEGCEARVTESVVRGGRNRGPCAVEGVIEIDK